MPKIDLTNRSADILVLFFMNILFLAILLLVYHCQSYLDLREKVWGLFTMTNGALLYALNLTNRPPTPPATV